MVSYAIDDVEDAFSATKDFLLPFEWGRWWRLAVVALFVASGNGASGGASTASSGGSTAGGVNGLDGFEFVEPTLPAWTVAAIVAIALVAVVVGLLFAFVSATMQFVMVESLRTEAVHIRRYFTRRWRQGLRLFGFQLGVGIVFVAVVALLVGLVAGPAIVLSAPLVAVLAALVAVPLLVVTIVAVLAVTGFTNAFVVPTMIVEDCGVLAGWRRFWPVFRANWGEYVAFALVYVVLLFLAGIVVSIATGIAAFVLLVPFGIVGVAAFALANSIPVVGIPLLVLVALLYVVSILVVVAFAQVPVVTYFRYYGLFVLGDTDEGLDLIGNRRRAVRGEDGPDESPAP